MYMYIDLQCDHIAECIGCLALALYPGLVSRPLLTAFFMPMEIFFFFSPLLYLLHGINDLSQTWNK